MIVLCIGYISVSNCDVFLWLVVLGLSLQLPAVRPFGLKKLSRPKKTISRAYGGSISHKCLRQR